MKTQGAAPLVSRRFDPRLHPGARTFAYTAAEREEHERVLAVAGPRRGDRFFYEQAVLERCAWELGVELDPAAVTWCLAAMGHHERIVPAVTRIEIEQHATPSLPPPDPERRDAPESDDEP